MTHVSMQGERMRHKQAPSQKHNKEAESTPLPNVLTKKRTELL